MAKRPKPGKADSKRYKVVKYAVPKKLKARQNPILNRFTAVWVQSNGVPFDTTGFFATLTRTNTGQLVSTRSFDPFGVVRFGNIRTLTRFTYTLRTFDSNGVLFRTRVIPPGVEAFAIIG